MSEHRIWKTKTGEYRFALGDDERDVLRSLPDDLRGLFDRNDPSLQRLFPPAYLDDPKRESEYQELMKAELIARHLEALRVMEETVDEPTLTHEQLSAWMQSLNQVRLVLGTRLDISEEFDESSVGPDDPNGPIFILYSYLGWLQHEVVEALTESLPPPNPD